MNSFQFYIDQYRFRKWKDMPDFVVDIKDEAMEKLSAASFPKGKDEQYLYTDIASLLQENRCLYQPSEEQLTFDKINRFLDSDLPDLNSYSLIFNNGFHVHKESVHVLPGGIVVGSFLSTVRQFSEEYEKFFTDYSLPDDILINLNAMLSGDGFFVFVPANMKPGKPIQITNLFHGNGNVLTQPRNLIIMEPGSSADILLCDYTLSDESFMCNDVTDVVLAEGASLNLTRLQKVNGTSHLFTHTNVRQKMSSHMTTHYISLNGATIRNDLKVNLTGKEAEHYVKGLAFTQQSGHIDNDVHIVHASPDCRSNQLFKHILSDISTGAFTGRIVVDEGAQKTLAYQRSSNILLDAKAKMNIRPQLEIYADDVKCSHGATVGQLDNEALFYLRSRGIGKKEAQKILLQAFAEETLEGISSKEIKNEMIRLVEQKMVENFPV
ncbi:MAG: Fe-S cluster assembly protein SufD [Bacteroidales bacterium]|jgi:Fe-S cluster assembly protein SufD|nr:Fe-S cluster assembly protein SufD [Bacteroidales bacterium]